MSPLHIKPAPGLKIRNPDRNHTHLADDGEVVPMTDYWIARLRDGDVVEVIAPSAASADPGTKPKK